MNLKTFILIIAMKLFAVQIIAAGIYCELRANCTPGFLFITVGSLIFAIASNTTLFCVVYSRRRKKGGERNHARIDNEDNLEFAPDYYNEHNTDIARARRFICRGIREES
jgi:hypothetical protein